MNAITSIILIVVGILVLGKVLKLVKYFVIGAIIFALVTEGYINVMTSPEKLLELPNVKYVQNSNADKAVNVIPTFEGGVRLKDTTLPNLLDGPKGVVIEYSSEKFLNEFKEQYNKVKEG